MQPHRLLPRQQSIGDRLVLVRATGIMVGENPGMFPMLLGLERLDSLGNGAVQRLPPAPQEALIGHILDQGMLEPIRGVGDVPVGRATPR